MAAVSVTAAPAMGLLIVDSMTVPVDQRYSEGMLGAFSLIARVCLVKGGGKTYHWVVDVRRKPMIEPPTWPTLPPAVYTGLHAAEERLQSQIHTLEGGHGQTAVCASPYRIVLAHQRELTALAGEGDRPSHHASRRSWTAPL